MSDTKYGIRCATEDQEKFSLETEVVNQSAVESTITSCKYCEYEDDECEMVFENHTHDSFKNDDVNRKKSSWDNSQSEGQDDQIPVWLSEKLDGVEDVFDIKDPACDPDNPQVLSFEQISAAAYMIRGGVRTTPCDYSHISDLVGMDIYLKKEFMQFTGSFKERGARYTLMCLSERSKKDGVIAASAGNHAQALAYHGGILGIPVTVVMPKNVPIMKKEKCKRFGADVIVKGANIGESREVALKLGRERNLTYINGFDHPNILAGQGTMGLEILEQIEDVDAIVIPVGGAGLLAGTAKAVKTMKPSVEIIGVEPELCQSLKMAMKHNKPVKTKTGSSIADGLCVPTVGVNALATLQVDSDEPLVDRVVSVSEEWIAISILRLVEMEKAVVEGGGAAGVAAVLSGALPELRDKKVVIPLCGGNIDTTVLGRCIDRGLAADGRLIKFTVTVSDRPGGISELAKLLNTLGLSIKDIVHERAWIKNDIFSVEVIVVAECTSFDHAVESLLEIINHYKCVRLTGVCDKVRNRLSKGCNHNEKNTPQMSVFTMKPSCNAMKNGLTTQNSSDSTSSSNRRIRTTSSTA